MMFVCVCLFFIVFILNRSDICEEDIAYHEDLTVQPGMECEDGLFLDEEDDDDEWNVS